MKNITLKGMKTMPSEHEACDGELSLAINLVNHAGEWYPRQISEHDTEMSVDTDGYAYRRIIRHQGIDIFERYDDDNGYSYHWSADSDTLHPFWYDDGQKVNATSSMGELLVFASDSGLVYHFFDQSDATWHHLRQETLRYTIEVDQRMQHRVTLRTPVDSTLQRYLLHADEVVNGQATLLKRLFTEWRNNDVATGASLALARMEQVLDRELSHSGSHEHKHIRLIIATLRLFDGSQILMSNPFALAPADGEPTLTVVSNGDEKMLCTNTCLHSHTVKVRLAEDIDEVMARQLVQGIDIYQSPPMTMLDLSGATTIDTDSEGMATRLCYSWADANTLTTRLAGTSFQHALHIALTDFGQAVVIPRNSDGDTLDISDMRRQSFGARVLRTLDSHLCAAAITTKENSAFSIPVSCMFRNLDGEERTTDDDRLMECLCGERPDIDEQEEGLPADVVCVVHLREGTTAGTRAFIDHLRYPLPGILAYPDRRAYAMDLHLRFTDSSGSHFYRKSVSLRPLGTSGMAIALWSGNGGGHACGRAAVHSLILQQARSMRYDATDQRWHDVADLWTRETAEEWMAAEALAQQTPSSAMRGNRMYTSVADNPLVFPAGGRITIGDGTINALTSRVKRYGGIQFGQYPLYAFCSDGVWALQRGDGIAWRDKYQVSRYPCVAGQPVETDDHVAYLSEQGLVRLDGGTLSRMGDALSGELFDTSTLPYFDMMMNTLFGERFAHLPCGRLSWSSNSRLIYDKQWRQISIIDPTQTLHATCDSDSGEWGLVEYGAEETDSIPVVALTRQISTATHEWQRWRRVEICGLFRKRHEGREPLLCLMLWGSNEQFHWHLLGSSRCPVLQLPTGSPWRWHRIAIAGWMARDERISHVIIRTPTPALPKGGCKYHIEP